MAGETGTKKVERMKWVDIPGANVSRSGIDYTEDIKLLLTTVDTDEGVKLPLKDGSDPDKYAKHIRSWVHHRYRGQYRVRYLIVLGKDLWMRLERPAAKKVIPPTEPVTS